MMRETAPSSGVRMLSLVGALHTHCNLQIAHFRIARRFIDTPCVQQSECLETVPLRIEPPHFSSILAPFGIPESHGRFSDALQHAIRVPRARIILSDPS